jgi:hypothetical protein
MIRDINNIIKKRVSGYLCSKVSDLGDRVFSLMYFDKLHFFQFFLQTNKSFSDKNSSAA